MVLVVSGGAIEGGVIASFTDTEEAIPRLRKPAHSAAILAATTLGGDQVIIQGPAVGELQRHPIHPARGVSGGVAERHYRSIGPTLHGFEVELAVGVEVGGGIDAAGVGGREEREAEGGDGGASVEGGAEVVEGWVAEGGGEGEGGVAGEEEEGGGGQLEGGGPVEGEACGGGVHGGAAGHGGRGESEGGGGVGDGGDRVGDGGVRFEKELVAGAVGGAGYVRAEKRGAATWTGAEGELHLSGAARVAACCGWCRWEYVDGEKGESEKKRRW